MPSYLTAPSSATVIEVNPPPANPAGRFVRLRHDLLNSPQWKALPATERAVCVEIAKRYNGRNNGRIVYSARECAKELHFSKAAANRAIRRLESADLIRCVTRGSFNAKDARASEWALTDYDTVSPQRPDGLTTETVNGANGLSGETLIDKKEGRLIESRGRSLARPEKEFNKYSADSEKESETSKATSSNSNKPFVPINPLRRSAARPPTYDRQAAEAVLERYRQAAAACTVPDNGGTP